MIRLTPTLASGGCFTMLLFCGVPASLAADAPSASGAKTQPADAPARSTPRLADGRPDLSGYWRRGGYGGGGGGGGGGGDSPQGDIFFVMPARNGRLQNLENDSFISQKGQQNVPQYKPEYWAKVRDLDYNGNTQDPSFNCFPAGVPRADPRRSARRRRPRTRVPHRRER